MSAETASTTDRGAPTGPPAAVKLAGVVVALTAVITAMLLAFVLPTINSGPHDLPLGVAGPEAAVSQIEAGLSEMRPGAFETREYPDADAVRTGIEYREVVGGIVVGPEGPTVMVASAGGVPISQALTGLAEGLREATGAPVPVEDVVPLPADDPTGAGLSMLALPLVFGGMVPAIALVRLFAHSLTQRIVGAVSFAILAGFALTAVLQYGFGSLTGNFVGTSLAVSAGIGAISLTLLGLESLFGLPGFAVGAVTMVFVANPLSGMATTGSWLPAGWGTLGQLLPPGATGTVVRSAGYFDGHGAGGALVVLACWIAAGTILCVAGARFGRRGGADEPSARLDDTATPAG
ncbi:hypothetical protein SAMN05444695_10812 [Rhodococcus triatomae]|uniref:ABC transporter permease n=1 Tax=Rhodococcus triatomae TaxID=300028 RepID=A0A1G8KZH0_9NOCA|nr:hypothetical protein [Rhodococcus triatomae]SDI48779.1 hypothetical protein SAMN05444695_10812 [Rhodococcus triatomae]